MRIQFRCWSWVLVVLAAPPVARGETAQQAFTKGEAQVAQGQFADALESFANAARADRTNPEYLQHYALLRRVVDLRARLTTEDNPQRWQYMAKGLRAFYAGEGLLAELLKLDQELHRRSGTAESAALLGETQLEMGQNAEAVQTLSLEPDKASETTRALLGVAQARTGNGEAARQTAAKLVLPPGADVQMSYAAARLQAAAGDRAQALALLTSCFEATAPSQTEGFKKHAAQCAEFAALRGTPQFAAVLETKSKVAESKCSGGSSCAGCPMAGKCPKSQAQP